MGKKNPAKTPAWQSEFEFCRDGSSLAAPPLESKFTCCSYIPKQRTSRPWVPIFADNLSCSVRNGFRPIATTLADNLRKPKRQEGDPGAQATQERSVDERNYDSNIAQTAQTCKLALPQGQAIGLPTSQSAGLDKGPDRDQHSSISLPSTQDTETSGVGGIPPGQVVSHRNIGDRS
jgi:hypothetical protein